MRSCLQEESLQEYLDGELTAEACAEVSAHLAECAGCAANMREMEQAFAAIGGAFDDELSVVVPTMRLRTRIESALAEKAAPKLTLAQLFWRFGLVAASLLIVSVIVWFAFGTRFSTTPKPDHQVKAPLPTPSVTPSPQTPMPPALEARRRGA